MWDIIVSQTQLFWPNHHRFAVRYQIPCRFRPQRGGSTAVSEPADMPPDDAGELLRTCAHCGDQLADDDWHPVVTESPGNGETVLRSFCDEACKIAWETLG